MKNGIREFVCVGCGKRVVKSCTKSVQYCSTECYHKNRPYKKPREGVYKTCLVCGKLFYVPQYRANKAVACSSECQIEHQGRNKVHLICKSCGREFVRSPFFKDQEFCSIACRNKDPEFRERLVRMNADQNKKNPNRFETSAYKLLNELGIDYIPQYVINGKFSVDAYVPSKNTVIQFDGDYWHGNPAFYLTLDARQSKRAYLDISQDAYMRKLGISVVRIWQSEFKNVKAVSKKLLSI